MNNLYNYLFWFNTLNNTWYAIPTDKHMEFFNGKNNKNKIKGVMHSDSINTLILKITH